MPSIVLTNHDNGQLWGDAVDVAVVKSPDYMLGSVTTDTKIKGISRRIVVLPDRLTGSFETLDNRIPNINKIDISFGGLSR